MTDTKAIDIRQSTDNWIQDDLASLPTGNPVVNKQTDMLQMDESNRTKLHNDRVVQFF